MVSTATAVSGDSSFAGSGFRANIADESTMAPTIIASGKKFLFKGDTFKFYSEIRESYCMDYL